MAFISNIKMVVTDLDGTLLNSKSSVSKMDFQTLGLLGELDIVRVIATGRSPFSFEKVIPNNFPIDYLIFSSGAGVMYWPTKNILYTTELSKNEVQSVVDILIKNSVDFMVHEPIPANHRFLFYDSGNENPDFHRRIDVYNQFCQPLLPGVEYESSATQILAVLPKDIERFEQLKSLFPKLKVIRATSPLDGHSIWMEIFRTDVSKAYGIEYLCKELAIQNSDVITIGNDFNDIDMLAHYRHSFVVDNAPTELKQSYEVVKSNNESGFSDAVFRKIKGFIE
jgi:Cof subfamily protein (haloacid dehalogenase superfamily)